MGFTTGKLRTENKKSWSGNEISDKTKFHRTIPFPFGLMKKIALITDGIWPYVLGGMQKHSYYLCKYFAQNKIEVDLYHFNQSELNINDLNIEQKTVFNSYFLYTYIGFLNY